MRKTSLALAVVTAFCAAGAASAASTALVTVAHPAYMRAGDAVMGALAQSQPIHIQVSLKMRDRAGLDSFIAGMKNHPGQVMSQSEFMAKHAPSQLQAQTVVNYLKSMGYTSVVVAPNRLLVSADGTAATAQKAFLTTMAQVKTHDGRIAFANTSEVRIPASLQPHILGVVGLQTVNIGHTFAKVIQPNSGGHTLAVTGHDPTEFASIYGASGTPTAAGVTVGIFTQGKITQSLTDLNSFTSSHGLATVTTQTVQTGASSTDASGVVEWDLDSQDIVGMGGGQVGKIIWYNTTTLSEADMDANFNTIVSANAAKIIDVSIGGCETGANFAASDQIFAQGVAQGQTFSISTGDSGADECGNGAHTPSWPANSQYVIAASGTTLNASTTTWSSETVWSGSGGSESLYEPKPSWQTLWSGTHRGVADIAYAGDPSSGSKITTSTGIQQVGGTSLSAPLFAGAWARVIAAKGTGVGFAGPIVYQLPAAAFHDITSGSNGISAGVGYDLASGRGSMIVSTAINNIGGCTSNCSTPVANFSFTTSGLTANFTDSSTDSGGTINAHAWTFGDGATSTATSPSHTYAAAGTYSVSDKVTDNLGATNTKTSSVTVGPSGNCTGSVLCNGVAVTGLSGATGAQQTFTLVVPAGATGLSFVQSGGTGDSDMYVKFGSAPTTSSYDCRPYVNGNAETCNIATAQAGTYYVMLNGYAAYSGVSLKGSYTAGGPPPTCTPSGTVICSGQLVSLPTVATGGVSSTYSIVVPAGKTSLVVNIASGSGDADLYVKAGSAPTTASYDCRPFTSSSTESCTISSPAAGTYYMNVRAYAGFSGETLKATIN